jgi:hypothetical protein
VLVLISQGEKMGVAWLLGTDVKFNTPESISLPPVSSIIKASAVGKRELCNKYI